MSWRLFRFPVETITAPATHLAVPGFTDDANLIKRAEDCSVSARLVKPLSPDLLGVGWKLVNGSDVSRFWDTRRLCGIKLLGFGRCAPVEENRLNQSDLV